MRGSEQADLDAHAALVYATFANPSNAIDHAALSRLRARLEEIRTLAPARRGKEFEQLFVDILAAHGCQVERGKTHEGEQVDVFVHAPFRAIIECRWKGSPLQPRELNDLTGKLRKRPAVVAGIYVAMGGFTQNTRRAAEQEREGRTVLLWDSDDVSRLVSGTIHVRLLFEEHVSTLVRRYSSDGA
jgi:hypothetical protein